MLRLIGFLCCETKICDAPCCAVLCRWYYDATFFSQCSTFQNFKGFYQTDLIRDKALSYIE